MIIKDYKYMNSTDGIHYTINVDGIELEMHHEKQSMAVCNIPINVRRGI